MEFLTPVWVALTAFFLIGEWGFFIVPVVAFLWVWWLVSDERGLAAFFWIFATALFVQFISKLSITGWVSENWSFMLWWALAYVGIGIAYALFRWYLHCKRKSRELGRHESTFRTDNAKGSMSMTARDKQSFLRYLGGKYNPTTDDSKRFYHVDFEEAGVIPTFDQNKYAIGRWFWYWPWSLLGWALNDLLREVFEFISRGLRGLMDHMARRVFGDQAALTLSAEEKRELEKEDDTGGRQRRSGHQ